MLRPNLRLPRNQLHRPHRARVPIARRRPGSNRLHARNRDLGQRLPGSRVHPRCTAVDMERRHEDDIGRERERVPELLKAVIGKTPGAKQGN